MTGPPERLAGRKRTSKSSVTNASVGFPVLRPTPLGRLPVRSMNRSTAPLIPPKVGCSLNITTQPTRRHLPIDLDIVAPPTHPASRLAVFPSGPLRLCGKITRRFCSFPFAPFAPSRQLFLFFSQFLLPSNRPVYSRYFSFAISSSRGCMRKYCRPSFSLCGFRLTSPRR